MADRVTRKITDYPDYKTLLKELPFETLKHTDNEEKISTGIPGMDEVLTGGFFKGNIIAVSGCVGSGKTLFSVQSLSNRNLKESEQALIISFEETPGQIKRLAKSIGFRLSSFVHILYIPPALIDYNKVFYEIKNNIEKYNVKHLLLIMGMILYRILM